MSDILSSSSFTKPILKWVGGKTQIISNIINLFPSEINDYHEIFLGGGSVLLALLESIKYGKIKLSGKIYAYDLNKTLINLYKTIQSNPDELYSTTKKIIEEYEDTCETENKEEINRNPSTIEEAKKYKENYYYWIRKRYNEITNNENEYQTKKILASAMFIFLNKTCFRGIYRVGPNGFNVPYGHYKNPEILNKNHLYQIHTLIKDVVFECKNFKDSLEHKFNQNDFLYLDPPYVPEKKTSFVGYNEESFDTETHINLFKKLNDLSDRKIKFIINNSDVKLVRDYFNLSSYKIISILCKRTINSKKPGSKTNELIIQN